MSSIKKKVVWLPYDFDTAIGINNEGALVFSYNLEDTDHLSSGADIYNGQESVFWCNLRDAFGDELKAMYQSLRSSGAWSYEKVEKAFEEHQAKWGEAIFNEDAWYKYLQPLVEQGTGAYLAMLQGSKEEQRKWWLYNRFKYLDSKYNAGDALSDVIQLRGYAKADVSVTPYADIYATVKYGSRLVQTRAERNKEYTLACPLDNVNDTEIYIYSASQLAAVGDLSGLKVGFADFSKATKIQNIKIGDSASDYSNGNMNELYLGNNVLLRTLDVRNCPNLGQGDMKSVDISGCSNIENVYFDGTTVTGVTLPNGGILKVLHLPETVTNLTVRNQKAVTDFTMPSYANISTLWLENVSSAIDEKAILAAIPESSRVRLIGFAWEAADAAEIESLLDTLDKMRGLDEYGNNMDKAQVSGTIHTDALTGAQIASYNERYEYLTVTADHTTSYLYYYNYDGSTLLYTETIKDGADGTYSGTPSRSADSYNTYTFAGWSTQKNATSANAQATKAVTADRSVYAAYTPTGRTYTVTFANNSSGSSVTLSTVTVAAGNTAYYSGTTPTWGGENPDDYKFNGWSPSNTNILANTTCYAQFDYIGIEETITDTWDEIFAAEADGTYKTKYKIGDTKKISLGTEGTVAMQIVAFDTDDLADGSGTAPITWISEQLLKTSRRWNPNIVSVYAFKSGGKGWGSYGNASSTTSNFSVPGNIIAAGETATWTCTFTAASDFKVQVPSQSISSTGSGFAGDWDYSVAVNSTEIYRNTGGTVSTAAGTEASIASGASVTIVLSFKQDTNASADAYKNIGSAYLKFTDSADAQTSFAAITGGASNATVTISDNTTRQLDSYKEGTGSVGGWPKSELRTYYKETLKPLIPENVRNAIKEVTKTYGYWGTGTSESYHTGGSSTEDVWAPSFYELFGYTSSESGGKRYSGIFTDNASRVKKKAGSSSAYRWWLRSAGIGGRVTAYYVGSSGDLRGTGASDACALALGFST